MDVDETQEVFGVDEAELFGVTADDWRVYEEFGKKGFFKKISRAVKKVAKNPLVRIAAGGLAFVVPPVGIAGIALNAGAIASTANKIIKAGKGKDPKKRAAARQVAEKTKVLALQGDPAAKRAYSVLQASAARGGDLRAKPKVRARPAAAPTLRQAPAPAGQQRRITWEVLPGGGVRRVA